MYTQASDAGKLLSLHKVSVCATKKLLAGGWRARAGRRVIMKKYASANYIGINFDTDSI